MKLLDKTILGRIDFKENIYFRKETIEDNLSSGIIDLRKSQDAHSRITFNWVKTIGNRFNQLVGLLFGTALVQLHCDV